jgi:hypothetical protein
VNKPRSSLRFFLFGKGRRCISIRRPSLATLIFAGLVSGSAFPVAGAIDPTRIEFVLATTAGARDGTNYDLPPDRRGSVITNGFWAYETNFACTASMVSASGQSTGHLRADILPLLITTVGDLTAAASIDTNRDETASAQSSCRLDLLFGLSVQHAYSISVTNLGSVSSGNLLGQILLTRNDGEELFASRLPTNSSRAFMSGVLSRGSYRLLAEFVVSPLQAPPAAASSGSATFYLQMTFDPILPMLNIARPSNNVVLSWTTNDTAFVLLQSHTNLAGTNWTLIYGPYPISGSEYSVEQSVAEPAKFFRLIAP